MARGSSKNWISAVGACLAVVLGSPDHGRAQSISLPAVVVSDAADQLLGPASLGPGGFVSLVLEVDGVLAQFDVVQNGPESQQVWFDGNDCFGDPYLATTFLQALATMEGTQFAVAGGDPLAVNPAMMSFNTYSSPVVAGTLTTVKSTWSMQSGCVDFGPGTSQIVVAGTPVVTEPFAGMSRPFKVVKPTQAIVVVEP